MPVVFFMGTAIRRWRAGLQAAGEKARARDPGAARGRRRPLRRLIPLGKRRALA